MILEGKIHEHKTFVTLTYSDDHLPTVDNGRPTLVPAHLRDYIKRLRTTQSSSIRYFGVGEYGDQTQRPHYHLALYGVHPCSNGRTIRSIRTRKHCCLSCETIGGKWPYGSIYQGELNDASIQYCASYTVKKLTSKDDLRLDGRHPEFTRMSRMPGLGAAAMQSVHEALVRYRISGEDVPRALRTEGKIWPLDRYTRNLLRRLAGRPDGAPPAVLAQMEAELSAMLSTEGLEDKELQQLYEEKISKAKLREEQVERRNRNLGKHRKQL